MRRRRMGRTRRRHRDPVTHISIHFPGTHHIHYMDRTRAWKPKVTQTEIIIKRDFDFASDFDSSTFLFLWAIV